MSRSLTHCLLLIPYFLYFIMECCYKKNTVDGEVFLENLPGSIRTYSNGGVFFFCLFFLIFFLIFFYFFYFVINIVFIIREYFVKQQNVRKGNRNTYFAISYFYLHFLKRLHEIFYFRNLVFNEKQLVCFQHTSNRALPKSTPVVNQLCLNCFLPHSVDVKLIGFRSEVR